MLPFSCPNLAYIFSTLPKFPTRLVVNPQKVGSRIKDKECWDSLYISLKPFLGGQGVLYSL